MRLTRRRFLKSASASAVLPGTHLLGPASGASAASPAGPILVLVNLAGGNDLLGSVIPLDDVGAPQRSLYQALRPDLAVPLASLAGLGVDPDPVLGTGLALHPTLAGLHPLYGEGKLALVLGAGPAGNSLSHFEAEKHGRSLKGNGISRLPCWKRLQTSILAMCGRSASLCWRGMS